MRDWEVRLALKGRLSTLFSSDPNTLVVEELGLRGGAVRADLAVINGNLKGYEIKSDRDTLNRLAHQSDIYSKVFDTITLIVAERHLHRAETMVPEWWGLELAVRDCSDGAVQLVPVRSERLNNRVEAIDVVQLLWREEVLQALNKVAPSLVIANKPRKFLWQALASRVSLPELQEIVREYLRCRERWRAAEEPLPSDARCQPCAMSSDSLSPQIRSRNRRYTHRPN